MNIEQLVNLKAEAIRQVAMADAFTAGACFLLFATISGAVILYAKRDSYRGDGDIPGACATLSALFAVGAAIIALSSSVVYMTANARAVDAIANHQMISLGK